MAWAETERKLLAQTLAGADPAAPTLCEGWDTRHLLAHLVQREHKLAASVGDIVVKRQPGQEKYLGKLVDGARSPEGYQALVARFLRGAPRWSPMSLAGDGMNLVEYVVHHEDVRRGSGSVAPRVLPEDEANALWAKLGVFSRLSFRRSQIGVTLALPSGASQVAQRGTDGVVLTGDAVELALYITGRRSAADVEVSGRPETVSRFESWVATS